MFRNEDGQTEMAFYNAALISVFSCENHFHKVAGAVVKIKPTDTH